MWDAKERVFRAGKVLRASDATSLLRFVRELGYRIHHPNVLAPLGWVGEDDKVMFTMDLVRGGSVASLLGDYGALPPAWVAVLLDQLLDGLGAVHAAGLVHRDVKPANLLLEPTGPHRPHLLLSDFGIAAPVDGPRFTSVSIVLGTLGYLAPEQLRGAVPDPRQDLYAAGAVAVEMLTGGLTALPAGQRPPTGVPLRLWEVVRRLVAVEPAQRWATANAAREALAATGCLPAQGEQPDDEGRDIEVLEHVPAQHAFPTAAAGDLHVPRQTALSGADAPTTVQSSDPATVAGFPAAVGDPPTRAMVPERTRVLQPSAAPLARRERSHEAASHRAAILAAAACVVTGIVVMALGLRHAPAGPKTPSVPPATSSTNVLQVSKGDACTWADQLTAARTKQKVPMTCTPAEDGSFSWQRTP